MYFEFTPHFGDILCSNLNWTGTYYVFFEDCYMFLYVLYTRNNRLRIGKYVPMQNNCSNSSFMLVSKEYYVNRGYAALGSPPILLGQLALFPSLCPTRTYSAHSPITDAVSASGERPEGTRRWAVDTQYREHKLCCLEELNASVVVATLAEIPYVHLRADGTLLPKSSHAYIPKSGKTAFEQETLAVYARRPYVLAVRPLH